MVQIIISLLLLDAMLSCLIPRKYFKGRLFIIPALVAVGMAGYQMYQSSQQKKAAKKLKPSNYVPGAVNEAIASSRMASTANSVGYNRGLEKIRRSSANSIDAAKRVGGSSAQIQQAVAGTDAREKEITKDLQVEDEAFRNANRSNLQSLLMTKGGYQKESMDNYNAAKSALIGAAKQNEYNAISGAAEGVVNSLPDKAFATKTDPVTGKAVANRVATGASASSTLTPEQQEFLKRLGIMKDYDVKKFRTGY